MSSLQGGNVVVQRTAPARVLNNPHASIGAAITARSTWTIRLVQSSGVARVKAPVKRKVVHGGVVRKAMGRVSTQWLAQAKKAQQIRHAAMMVNAVPDSVANRAALNGCTGGLFQEGAKSGVAAGLVAIKTGKGFLNALRLSPAGFVVGCVSGATINLLTLSSPGAGGALNAAGSAHDGFDVFREYRAGIK